MNVKQINAASGRVKLQPIADQPVLVQGRAMEIPSAVRYSKWLVNSIIIPIGLRIMIESKDDGVS